MSNQMFNSLEIMHLSIDDIVDLDALEIEDFPESRDEIDDMIEFLLDNAKEQAELELEQKLENASYPRYGFTTSDVFENEVEYKSFLERMLEEEHDLFRNTCYNIIEQEVEQRKSDEILNQVMTTKEVADELGITQQGVQHRIDSGHLHGRQSGKTWLVTRKDVNALWNK